MRCHAVAWLAVTTGLPVSCSICSITSLQRKFVQPTKMPSASGTNDLHGRLVRLGRFGGPHLIKVLDAETVDLEDLEPGIRIEEPEALVEFVDVRAGDHDLLEAHEVHRLFHRGRRGRGGETLGRDQPAVDVAGAGSIRPSHAPSSSLPSCPSRDRRRASRPCRRRRSPNGSREGASRDPRPGGRRRWPAVRSAWSTPRC